MAARLPPYIKWRGGRPRFHPSRREAKLGFAGIDLKDGKGAWLTYEQTCDAGWPIFAEILDCRGYAAGQAAALLEASKAGRALRLTPANKPHKRREASPLEPAAERGFSNEDLLDDFLDAMDRGEAGPKGNPLSPDAIESYRKAARAIKYKPETREAATHRRAQERAAKLLGLAPPQREKELFALKPVAAIGKIELNVLYQTMKAERGEHMARAAIAAYSAAYTWGGLSPKWRLGFNPRHELTIAQPEGRIVIYFDHELRALDAAAAYLERWSIGDSLFLGVMTAQRQRDRLLLKDEGLSDGRRMFRQSKTGTLVAVKETPMLTARLAAAKARVAAIVLKLGLKPEQRPDTVIVDESTGRPYVQDTYRHVFDEVRRVAREGVPAPAGSGSNSGWILEPCPSLRHTLDDGRETLKTDQDLRDTAVTWLARAGCTMAEICAISGHSAKSVQTIIEHYLGATRELADAGIDKLTAWMHREGIAL